MIANFRVPLLQLRNLFGYIKDFGLVTAIEIVLKRKSYLAGIHLGKIASKVYFRRNTCDFGVLRQVFCSGDHKICLDDVELIIDGGANVGYASILYANQFPGAIIYAVEPDRENCKVFRLNCSGYNNIHLLEGALWSESGIVRIEDRTAPPDSYRISPIGQSEEISAYTINDILRLSGKDRIDILKLDIEGSEIEVLSTSDQWINRVRVLCLELHDRLRPGCSSALARSLDGLSYSCKQQGEYCVIEMI